MSVPTAGCGRPVSAGAARCSGAGWCTSGAHLVHRTGANGGHQWRPLTEEKPRSEAISGSASQVSDVRPKVHAVLRHLEAVCAADLRHAFRSAAGATSGAERGESRPRSRGGGPAAGRPVRPPGKPEEVDPVGGEPNGSPGADRCPPPWGRAPGTGRERPPRVRPPRCRTGSSSIDAGAGRPADVHRLRCRRPVDLYPPARARSVEIGRRRHPLPSRQ